jgi:hypothetical protein
MAGYYESKTFTRAEWDELQRGVENQLRTSYDQYLTRVGLKSEAEAVAQRAKEDAEGKVFGVQSAAAAEGSGVFGYTTRADRKISDAEEAALKAAQAWNDANAAKQIAALTGGRITGNEAVYRVGTPEHTAYMQAQFDMAKATGKQPKAPDAYLDAQAFAERYMAYNRLGSNEPTVPDVYDPATNTFTRKPSPFYDPKISTVTPGMGSDWAELKNKFWSTVQPGVGSTAATAAAQYELDVLFGRQIGYAPGGTIRDFPNGVAGLGFVGGWAPSGATTATKTVTSKTTDGGGNTTTIFSDGSVTVTDASGTLLESSGGTGGGTLGSSAGKTGFEVFKNTLSLYFNAAEMNKPWVSQLYKTITGYTKTGSSGEEAFNMAVLESENKPDMAEFVKRFKGIYALQKMKQEGKAVTVPTVAEYFATEAKMGDILKQSSLGDLANEDFLGDVLSKGVSATEFGNRIVGIFDRIDTAPTNIKNTISRYFPSVDRISLAKAIALGDKGAKELQTKIAGYEVLAAAEKQGVGSGQLIDGTTEQNAYQYALGGETYDTALTKFGTVAEATPVVNKLTQIYNQPTIGQAGVESAVFGQSAAAIKAMTDLGQREQASFSGRSGVSQVSLASQRRGAGLI